LISVITSLGFDHMEILGSTLEEICHEKAGIIKPPSPAVIGPSVPCEWIRPYTDDLVQATPKSEGYDEENRETARLALERISQELPLSKDALEKGLGALPPCRFERLQKQKSVVLDVAH